MNENKKDFPCVHGRASWRDCPHCLGINNQEDVKVPETLEISVTDSVSGKDLGPGQKK